MNSIQCTQFVTRPPAVAPPELPEPNVPAAVNGRALKCDKCPHLDGCRENVDAGGACFCEAMMAVEIDRVRMLL